jgi:hypothetical protein
MWMRTRDYERVAGLWERSEAEAIAIALFDWRHLRRVMVGTVIDRHASPGAATGGKADRGGGAGHCDRLDLAAPALEQSRAGPGLPSPNRGHQKLSLPATDPCRPEPLERYPIKSDH